MQKILIQLDTDPAPSTFDRVVAVDSGVDQLFSYGSVTPDTVTALAHGAMFTRGPKDLHNTAIFIGGSDVEAGEKLLASLEETFFGPMRVSVLMDSNGSNTTAAAAVLSAAKHIELKGCEALILGGTGPVGARSAQILASQGALVRVASRSFERAQQACNSIKQDVPEGQLFPYEFSEEGAAAALDGVQLIIAAGAAGVQFLSESEIKELETLKVAIDVNAVPPAGLQGIEVSDQGEDRNGAICYGAIGVGGLKMKIHRKAVQQLFESNDQVLNTAEIFELGQSL